MTDWRDSRIAAAVILLLFIGVQLAIPIARLDSDSSQRFGWQMYSAAHPTPQFQVFTETGEIEIDLDDYRATNRADVDLRRWLPPHLCAKVDGAVSVTWDDGSYEC